VIRGDLSQSVNMAIVDVGLQDAITNSFSFRRRRRRARETGALHNRDRPLMALVLVLESVVGAVLRRA